MTHYVTSTLFIYTESTHALAEELQKNEFNTQVFPVKLESFLQQPSQYLKKTNHVIISGLLTEIKVIISLSIQYKFSIGLIPDPSEKRLISLFDLPSKSATIIELALQNSAQEIDIALCNGEVLLFNATIGKLPLLDATDQSHKARFFFNSLKRSFQLKLCKFKFITEKGQELTTAASGCMILNKQQNNIISKLIPTNGGISVIISSPNSIAVYCNILLKLLYNSGKKVRTPQGIGYIESTNIKIETRTPLNVNIDGNSETSTPLKCQLHAKASLINTGENYINGAISSKESVKVTYLPNEKEIEEVSRNNIPFFTHASEERFRDLFISLRDDAKINSIYITLIILSTMLATIGLFQGSSAVIIGAMLLAPLMAPIVSLAMGLLRGNIELLKNSISKIALGVFLALLASAIIAQIFPHKMITGEISARLSPTLLDLAVAIISGIAGAYSKSFKEIIQSLAGVAIAVALVPPLAVAGIGIGRVNLDFFLHAFLLFSTNLIGITLAATLTFRILGFSPIVYAKRGISIVFLLFMLISIPLYTSYERIITTLNFESAMERNRFLVNGKYIMIHNPRLTISEGTHFLLADVLTRDSIERRDLIDLKNKIKLHFTDDLVIKIRILYIL